MNPFLALVSPGTTRTHGEVFAMSLVYSGNFLAQAEVDRLGGTRLSPSGSIPSSSPGASARRRLPGARGRAGPFLAPGSADVLALSTSSTARGSAGDGAGTGSWPILVNNWEGSYLFNLTPPRSALGRRPRPSASSSASSTTAGSESETTTAAPSAIGRSTSASSPSALPTSPRGDRDGPRFGLWFEPEMVSPDSELYRPHPDWCLHVPGAPARRAGISSSSTSDGTEVRAVRRFGLGDPGLGAYRLREVGHESALDEGSADLPSAPIARRRGIPSLHPRALRGDGRITRAFPESSSRAARAGEALRLRGCSPTCPKPGRATIPTQVLGSRSSRDEPRLSRP